MGKEKWTQERKEMQVIRNLARLKARKETLVMCPKCDEQLLYEHQVTVHGIVVKQVSGYPGFPHTKTIPYPARKIYCFDCGFQVPENRHADLLAYLDEQKEG